MRTPSEKETAALAGTSATANAAHSADSTVSQADYVTVLETIGPCLTKIYKSDGTTDPYDDAASFHYKVVEVADLQGLVRLLGKLHANKKRCLIAGAPKGEGMEAGNVEGSVTRTNANFTDQPLHSFVIDIDGYRPGFADPIADTENAILDFFADHLPTAFQDCSFYWHLSSSAGMPGKEGVLKCHVWLWSKTAYTCAQLTEWAKVIGPAVDRAVYRRVQIRYTADPIFEPGRVDPVPVRCGFHQGATDYVDLVIDEETLAKARDQGSGEGGHDMVLRDPSEKDGLIGAFHRAFTAEDVLLNFLEGFEQVTERRYTWHGGGGTPEGVWVHDDGQHIGSSHNTWPIDGIANLWDVVRVFKFGDLDDTNAEETFETLGEQQVGSRPSDLAMKAWAGELPELKEFLQQEAAEKRESTDLLVSDIATATSEQIHNDIVERVRSLKSSGIDAASSATLDKAIQKRLKELSPVKAQVPIADVRQMTKPEAPAKPKEGLRILGGDQYVNARELFNTVFRDHNNQPLLARVNESWYQYGNGFFNEVNDETIRHEAWPFLSKAFVEDENGKLRPMNPGLGAVTGIVDALKSVARLPLSAPPMWMPGYENGSPLDLLVVTNGILNVHTGELIAHTPRYFSTNGLTFAFDPAATSPSWRAFLDQLWPDDFASQDLLQEWFGYCLTADTRQQKFLMVIGPKRSGKGTIGRILQHLVGMQNFVGPTLSSIAERHGLEPWINKLVAIVGDSRSAGKEPQVAVERILSITGEDSLSVPRMYRTAVNLRLTARITVLSNELLKLGDASGALVGRMLVLKMEHSFFGKEDTGLEERLVQELPGILNWALEGKRRLVARGRFIQPASAAGVLQDTHDINNPVGAFVGEYCELGEGFQESLDALFSAWGAWCGAENRHPGTRTVFGKDFKAAFSELHTHRPRDSSGKQRLVYQGIRIADEIRDQLFLNGCQDV